MGSFDSTFLDFVFKKNCAHSHYIKFVLSNSLTKSKVQESVP